MHTGPLYTPTEKTLSFCISVFLSVFLSFFVLHLDTEQPPLNPLVVSIISLRVRMCVCVCVFNVPFQSNGDTLHRTNNLHPALFRDKGKKKEENSIRLFKFFFSLHFPFYYSFHSLNRATPPPSLFMFCCCLLLLLLLRLQLLLVLLLLLGGMRCVHQTLEPISKAK